MAAIRDRVDHRPRETSVTTKTRGERFRGERQAPCVSTNRVRYSHTRQARSSKTTLRSRVMKASSLKNRWFSLPRHSSSRFAVGVNGVTTFGHVPCLPFTPSGFAGSGLEKSSHVFSPLGTLVSSLANQRYRRISLPWFCQKTSLLEPKATRSLGILVYSPKAKSGHGASQWPQPGIFTKFLPLLGHYVEILGVSR